MIRGYWVGDVRAAEGEALARVPPGGLMQRAAARLAADCARELRARHGKVTGRRVALLVGAGDNGGDALWAGARLAGRGARVDAVLTSARVHAGGLAALQAAGGRALDATAQQGQPAAAALARADLVVDGLVGLGGRPGLREPAAGLVDRIGDQAVVVAVDLPSGVDPDTGETPAAHVRADLTVTFGAVKPCLLLPPGSAAAGRVLVADIGLAPWLPAAAAVERLTAEDAAAAWPVPDPAADKYRRGVLGVVAGSAGYPGAAVLACGGAVRAGVGMVRYLGPESVACPVRSAWPEVVAGEGRVQAWALGSGVDPEHGGDQPEAIARALASGEPCVVDAGGLTVLAAHLTGPLEAGARVLLTPHAGELATLLGALGEPATRADVEAGPYRHAALGARLTGATVLLKGATTLVVAPSGRARSQADAPSWLATAGAGDVLAGIAGALLAAGLDPLDVGSLAALVHGRAARLASAGGPIAAGDVAAAVPATVAGLLRGDLRD